MGPTEKTMDSAVDIGSALAGKYLTFALGEEVYGVEILKVQEIIGLLQVTHVPKTPSFIRGVVNLRGKVIPVIELRGKFAMPSVEDTDRTCIIVVQVRRAEQTVTMSIIVDEVSEVMNIPADQIEPPPSFGTRVETGFLLGVGKLEKKVVMLLDVDEVLSGSELNAVERGLQSA